MLATATAFPESFAYYVLYVNAQIHTSDTSTITTTRTIPNSDEIEPVAPVLVGFVVN